MPFSQIWPYIGRRTMPEETGSPDYITALTKGIEQGYKPRKLESEVYGQELTNRMNEGKAATAKEQAIAELKHVMAQTSNLGLEAGMAPLKKRLLEAQYQAELAKANKANIMANIFNRYANPNKNGSNVPPARTEPLTFAEQLLNPQSTGTLGSPQQTGNTNQFGVSTQQPNIDEANLAAQLMGLHPTSQVVNGQLVTNNPLTGISSTKVGPSAQEQAFESGLGKYGAELYKDVTNSYRGLQNQGVALQELTNALKNTEFRNVTGKINAPLTHWLGTPEQQDLLGRLQSTSGEIALQIAPALKGAFTGRDQTLINSIKANPRTDFPDEFIGKLQAQTLINDVLQERARLTATYIENNVKPLKALELAAQQTPLEKFKPQVDKLIKHKVKLSSDQLMKAKLELARRKGRAQ